MKRTLETMRGDLGDAGRAGASTLVKGAAVCIATAGFTCHGVRHLVSLLEFGLLESATTQAASDVLTSEAAATRPLNL